MVETKNCPRCGGRVPADAPAGICPKCLMKEGFETTVGVQAHKEELPAPGEQFGGYRIGRRVALFRFE